MIASPPAFDLSCANVLPNGAQILGRLFLKPEDSDPVWIALCHFGGAHPYVT